jgi:hypothetical protein
MSKPWINGWDVCNVITELWISYAMAESPASIVICKKFPWTWHNNVSNWTRGQCSGNWYSFNMSVSAWHSCSLGSIMQCTYSPCRSWVRNPFVDMRSESILSIHCVLYTEYYSMRKNHRVCLVSGVKFVRGRVFHVLLKVGYGNWLWITCMQFNDFANEYSSVYLRHVRYQFVSPLGLDCLSL